MAEGPKDLDLTAVWRVIDKFKESVLRIGLNLYEQFQKFDPAGEQLMSEYFFRKVLEVCLRNEVPLSEDEIRTLVNYFQYRDGRIMYNELCDRVHDKSMVLSTDVKANLMTGLEWEDPLHINAVKPEEEIQLIILLNRIANVMVRSDHPIDVHFKEYEQIARNPGCVSFEHLARILREMSINLSQDDFNLLIKRYSRHSFLFNFIPFLDELNEAIKCIGLTGPDDVNIRHVLNTCQKKLQRPDICYPKSQERGKEWGLPVSFRLLTAYSNKEEGPLITMRRIKKFILTNGINLYRIFQDLDKLNWGIVSESNFRRALTNSGINCGLNSKLTITEEDIENLIKIYQRPNEKDTVMWRLFVNDIIVGMVKQTTSPETYDEDSDLRFLMPQGNVWSSTPEEVRILCEETLNRLRTYLKARRWTLKQFFEEWDSTKSGHVNILYFRNILTSNELVYDAKELDALEKRYADSKGFDYHKFLDELRTENPLDDVASVKSDGKASKTSKSSIDKRVDPCYEKEFTDVEIANAVRRIRKRIVINSRKLDDYFKQFDPLNKFTVSKQEFLRVLASNNIDFSHDEAEILSFVFKAPLQKDRVDYRRFLDMIDEAYTQKNLDKAPLIIPIKHIPVTDDPDRFLNMGERRLVESALDKLSNKLCMINFDDIKCFDRNKTGDLERYQLLKALDSFKIRLTVPEIDAIMKAFGRITGGVPNLEYLPLLKAVDILNKQKRFK